MYLISLIDDWDRTCAIWYSETKSEAEELKDYIDKKIDESPWGYKFSYCGISEPKKGTEENVETFFKEFIDSEEEEKEKEEENVSHIFDNIDKLPVFKNITDNDLCDMSSMFKNCKM